MRANTYIIQRTADNKEIENLVRAAGHYIQIDAPETGLFLVRGQEKIYVLDMYPVGDSMFHPHECAVIDFSKLRRYACPRCSEPIHPVTRECAACGFAWDSLWMWLKDLDTETKGSPE